MPARVRTVALIGKLGSPEATALAAELAELVQASGAELRVEAGLAGKLARASAAPRALWESELCVVVGGDGTLIRAARLLGAHPVPIFGVNAGRLGFLTEIPRERAVDLLTRVLAGDFTAEPRIKLRARLLRRDAGAAQPVAPAGPGAELLLEEEVLNDVVINRGAFARMVELQLRIDDQLVSRVRADGLIVATPTGSTAYNLSANGPILMPAMDGLVITPICPHALTQRPLVVADTSRLSIEVLAAQGEILLSLDGQSSAPLQTGDRVELERSANRALLVRNPEVHFFGVLREKLRWGEGL